MGTSKAEKTKSHERILALAAAQIRQTGLDGVGISDLMKSAGLTQGGFYRHFSSRDNLIEEATEHALAEGRRRVALTINGAATDPLAALIETYVSINHRDDVPNGCAVVSLATDIPRSADTVRAAYSTQVDYYLKEIQRLIAEIKKDDETSRPRAILAFSSMVGAVTMARAVNDEELSLEILSQVSEQLKMFLGCKSADPPMAPPGDPHDSR